MTLWLVVLLAGLLWFGVAGRKTAARKGKSAFGWGWVAAAAVLLLLTLRFGMHWIVVAGGALLAAGRALLPIVRVLPLLRGVAQFAGRAEPRPPPGAPGGEPHGGGAGTAPGRARMSRQEALQVLGLTPGASADDVMREYRRLMKKLHPDLGGSTYLAAKLNEARDVLL